METADLEEANVRAAVNTHSAPMSLQPICCTPDFRECLWLNSLETEILNLSGLDKS
jgi:hypothetical protein